MTAPLIAFDSVTRRYGSGPTAVAALLDVTFEVCEGDRIVLMGPSGSGKTTLMSLLGMLDRPDSGSVLYRGTAAEALTDAARTNLRRNHIGFVFQMFHLISALSALDNVLVPLAPYRPAAAVELRARNLLGRMGLGDRLGHRPGQLSGGEQQRVAIARALISEPELVLADEPTGNLDSTTARLVVDLLEELRLEQGFALVVATHDSSIAARFDRKLALLDGHLMT